MNCRHCHHIIPSNERWCPNCGEFVPESLVGQVLGSKYELLGVLGVGGMGAVYRARRNRIGDEVVVKILLPSLSQESGRFRREAEAAASVKHSNVVIIIHDSDEGRGEFPAFIAMEMVKGLPLRHLLQSEGRLEPARAIALMRRICAGVGAAHKLGVVHRDLKPENVMVAPPEEDGETETVKVLDFGIAKLLDKEVTRLTQDGAVLGTAYYMPPEQWRSEEVDARADVYSLGVMLYEMLTGKWPFTGRTRDELMTKHLFEPPPSLTLEQSAPSELDDVIKRALAKEPDARQQNATELSRELQAAIAVTLPSVPTFEFDTVTLDARGEVIAWRKGRARYFVEDLGGGQRLEMVEIPAGTFMMGSPESEAGSKSDERPQHEVSVPSFYMGKFEVTQAQWRAVARLSKVSRDLNPDPSEFKGDNLPVEQVNWEAAVEFCKRLSKKIGCEYRLPSEAEWEYAARAGMQKPFAFGETITREIVNYAGKYPYAGEAKGTNGEKTVVVGSLGAANGFGLYDLHGNVWEWCLDHWHSDYSGARYDLRASWWEHITTDYRSAPTDGSAWLIEGDVFASLRRKRTSDVRVLRGGSWLSHAKRCRSASRSKGSPSYSDSVGFRVVVVSRS